MPEAADERIAPASWRRKASELPVWPFKLRKLRRITAIDAQQARSGAGWLALGAGALRTASTKDQGFRPYAATDTTCRWEG